MGNVLDNRKVVELDIKGIEGNRVDEFLGLVERNYSDVVKTLYISRGKEDRVEKVKVIDLLLSKVYGDVDKVDSVTKRRVNEFLSFVSDNEDVLVRKRMVDRDFDSNKNRNPIGFDDMLLKLSVDYRELFDYLSKWKYTSEYVRNFDYNIGGKSGDELYEISTKIFYSMYNGRTEFLENYFLKYVDSMGVWNDEVRDGIKSIMDEVLTYTDDYEDCDDVNPYTFRGDSYSGSEMYNKLLDMFKLNV